MHSNTESDDQQPITGLALEVIGREGSVAFIREGEVLQSADLPSDVRATASLTPALQSLLMSVNTPSSDGETSQAESSPTTQTNRPDFIAVADGPGSFTGLRIAAATAKTLAYAWGIPVVTLDSLSVLAAAVLPDGAAETETSDALMPSVGQRMIVGLDAYRGQTFVGIFAATEAGWQTDKKIELLDRADWLQTLDSAAQGTWLTGDAIKPGLPTAQLRVVGRNQTLAAALAKLAHQKYLVRQITDPMEVLPRYFRPSAAEEKAAASK